ncbi:MAG: DEAD/DEAH box helicase [Bacilli bacterium]|nr:DEAD/DEAH box helicase [Bacilli bacterium]
MNDLTLAIEENKLPELYSWQKQAIEKWEKAGRHGIFKVATGGGKTICALHLAASMDENTRIKIVVPTVALAKQWKKDILSFGLAERVGEWHGDKHSAGDMRFMIYVCDSARYALCSHALRDMREGKSVFLICDECQHYGSKENQKIFHFIGAKGFTKERYFSLGLSATPECANFDAVIKPNLGDIIFDFDLAKAQESKVVIPFLLFQIEVYFSGKEIGSYLDLTDKISKLYATIRNTYVVLRTLDGDDFFNAVNKKAEEDPLCEAYVNAVLARNELVLRASNRVECAKELIDRLPSSSRIIVFSERIEQAESIYRRLQEEKKVRVRLYHSELSPEAKKNALNDFRYGEARVLISCKALDEGLNVPDADVGIVLSCTHGDRQRIQRLGRILRKTPGKSPAKLYYLYVSSTSDPLVYLRGNSGALEVGNLSYVDGVFDYDAYLAVCESLLDRLEGGMKDMLPVRRKLRRNFEKGIIRGDYLFGEELLLSLIEKNSDDEAEADYYRTMLCLARIRLGKSPV